jgi:small subunit ribosomal protein S8
MASKADVLVPASKLKSSVLDVLKTEGYIAGFRNETVDGKAFTRIELKYYRGQPVIETISRVSKPGRRIYRDRDSIPSIMGGFGIAIVSTSKGVMSDRKARAIGEGGEVLCLVA